MPSVYRHRGQDMTPSQAQQPPKPSFKNGDIVRLKAKSLRTKHASKNHKGRVFTVKGYEWEGWGFGWLYTVKSWDAPDVENGFYEKDLTRVKVPTS
jgi:hypothetical protein